MDELIETMARTINSADPTFLPGHFHDRAVAGLIIKALDAAGFAIVPKEITPEIDAQIEAAAVPSLNLTA